MYRLVEVSTLSVSQLPEFEFSQVYQTFESANFEDAQAAVARLQKSADLCEIVPGSPGCPVVTP
jgi:acetylornithine/succinyldiaminopimelate/putrescine aminotransferase